MAATPTNPVQILQVSAVKPSPDSPNSHSLLPLTYFDTFWLKFHPVERIFFYQFNHLTRSSFQSYLLPKLVDSLSLALNHFLPVAGKIRWPPHFSKPAIIYNPNDTVLVTIAESNSDFARLSGNQKIEATESRFYVPELPVSDSEAATVAFQITLFPNQGFSIGISSHHAVFDGKSITMFIKSWAYLNKQSKTEQKPFLSPELTPLFDRSVIDDPDGLDLIYSNNWLEGKFPGANDMPRSLKLLHSKRDLSNHVRSTFEFSREDIKKIRERVMSQLQDHGKLKSMHLSTFVLSFAYTLVCIVKARKLQGKTNVCFVFSADYRARLDPPISENYFGNCVKGCPIFTQAEVLLKDNGVAIVAEMLSEKVKGLDNDNGMRKNNGEKDVLARFIKTMELGCPQGIGIAGSPKFELYGTDFGWGKPKKMEITSIDRSASISMAESRDGSGAIEIGLVLKKHEMQMFDCLFFDGLKNMSTKNM